MEYNICANSYQIKKNFIKFFTSGVNQSLYKGFIYIFNKAIDDKNIIIKKEFEKGQRVKVDIKQLFCGYLRGIETWNEKTIENETNRILENSEYKHSLKSIVDCIVATNINFYLVGNPNCKEIINEYISHITLEKVIHLCYINASKELLNIPSYFIVTGKKHTDEKSLKEIKKIINKNIKKTLNELIPIDVIIKEYLSNSFIIKKDVDEKNNLIKFSLINNKSSDIEKIESLKNLNELITYSVDNKNKISNQSVSFSKKLITVSENKNMDKLRQSEKKEQVVLYKNTNSDLQNDKTQQESHSKNNRKKEEKKEKEEKEDSESSESSKENESNESNENSESSKESEYSESKDSQENSDFENEINEKKSISTNQNDVQKSLIISVNEHLKNIFNKKNPNSKIIESYSQNTLVKNEVENNLINN